MAAGRRRRWPSIVAGRRSLAQPPHRPGQAAPPGQPPAGRGGQQPAFRAGVELVSLNVTVTDGTGHYVTDLEQDDFSVFEDGVKQDVTFFNRTNLPIALALLLDTSASMESKLPTAQEAAIGFARRLRRRISPRSSTSTAASDRAAELHEQRRRARAGDPEDVGRRLDVALQRRVHRAEGPEEGRREERRRNPAPGDRRAVRRRGHVEPAAVRGSARPRQAIGDRDLHDRPARARRRRPARRASRKRSSSCASSRRKRAAARSSPASSPISPASTARSPTSSRASTVGYTSKNPKRDGAWRRVVVRVNRPNLTARTKQGYFAPTPH